MPTKFISTFFPILCLLYTAIMWGIIWYPLRLLEDAGMQGVWTTLVIYGVSLLLGLALSYRHTGQFFKNPFNLFMIALTSGWCNVAFVLAIIDGNVVRVLLLFYLSPVWTVMFGWWILNERISRTNLLVLLVAIVGALVMLWDPQLDYPWPQDASDWLALSSGFTFALSNVYIRREQEVSVRVKTSVSWIGVVLVALLVMASQSEPLPQVGISVWWAAIALGVFGTFFMTLAVQYGVTHMPVHRSAVILLFELVAGAVSSQLLTDEIISPWEWAGGLLIVVAAYLAATSQIKSSSCATS